MRARTALYVFVAAFSGIAHADAPSFGSVLQSGVELPIRWEEPTQVELAGGALRLTQPASSVRSEPLALAPLQLYRVSTKMARGPGGTPRFAITYLDVQGKAIEWLPSWQHKSAAHANWLPLSPRTQRYVQGFVLPLGATQPRLSLRLDAGDKSLARYSHWTLSELRIDAVRKVACCTQLGRDLLFGGDFEETPGDGLPKHWAQWARTADNHVELVDLPNDPARKHVLRIKPQTSVYLSSSYLVPVEPGCAYRLSVMARGKGRVELDVHSLSRDRPTPLRVGNSTRGAGPVQLQTDTWQQLTTVWIAEAPNVAFANMVIAVSAESAIELDSVELRRFE